MKKLIFATMVTWFGFGLAVNAQLLYQWAFTNSADTSTNSIPNTYVTADPLGTNGWSTNVIPGTGYLGLRNISGDAITPGLIFFSTNSTTYGPPGSSFGSLVLNGQAYGNPSAIATNSNLTLGTLYKFSITFWVQYGSSVASASALARQVQFGASVDYDSGGKGGGNINGVGTAINGANVPVAGSYSQFQDGVASSSGSNPQVTITGDPNFANGFVCNGQTWYFEAMTYDGTTTTTNFTVWLASTNAVTLAGTPGVVPFVGSQPRGGIPFTTNASVLLAGCTGAARDIPTGRISDVRIYNGILTSNQLMQVRAFGYPIVSNPPTPAAVVIQPDSGSTYVGGNRTFSVTAAGNPPAFTYLWTSNGVPISGATNASYSLTNVAASVSGSFVCSVTNFLSGAAVGGTNSIPATITVLTPAPGSFAQAVFTNSPYSFWLVNEPSNSTPIVISDYANSFDGTALVPAGNRFQSGPTNTLYVGFPTNDTSIETPVTGTRGPLNTPPLPSYPNNTGMTICGWVYTPTTGNAGAGGNGLIYSLPSDTANGFGLIFGANNELDYQWGGANNTGSGLTIPSGEWTFVALVISTNLSQQDLANSIAKDTNATLYVGSKSTGGLLTYVDGTATTGHLIVSGSSQAPLALGRTTFTGSENGGYYDQSNVRFNDVAVFYKALSTQAINNLYLAGVGLPVKDKWVGNISSDWDTSTANWTTNVVPVHYSDGNAVFFDDTALNGNINLAGTFLPSSVTVSNNALAYTFGGGNISGTAPLTKLGSGTLTLADGGDTYSGLTTVGNGTLLAVSGINGNVDVTGGTLGGNFGIIVGRVTVSSGGTLAPGATLSTAGTFLTVGGLTLLPGSTTIMQVKHSGATLNGDQILNTGVNNISYGGTLIISTNAGDATTYKVGDKVVLFNNAGSGGFTNSFASIQPAPGPGLAWSNDAVNLGQFIVIVAPPVTPPVAGFSGVPTNIFVTQTVVFTNTSTGSYTNSAWSFGDGNVTNTSGASASNNVSNTYNNTGSDTVTLIVTGAGGSSTNTQAAYIAVKPKLTIGQPVPSSGNLILSGTNGPIGQQYRILSTTNVALNVANWTPVFTNVFTPPNGSYNFTNTAQTNNASFFRLVSP